MTAQAQIFEKTPSFFVIFTQAAKQMLDQIYPEFEKDMEEVEMVAYATVNSPDEIKTMFKANESVVSMVNPVPNKDEPEKTPFAIEAEKQGYERISVTQMRHLVRHWSGCTPL